MFQNQWNLARGNSNVSLSSLARPGALNELMQYSLKTSPLFLKQLKEMNFPIQVSPKASQEWVLSLVLWRVAWALGTCTGSSPEKFGLA